MAAAVASIGCSGRWALAQEPQRRREIVVNGKRVRTVDMHAHCHIPEATALASYKENFPGLVIGPERTKEMDEQGIDVEALSINLNFWDKLDRDLQARSSSCRMKSSPSSAPRSASALSGSARWR
jgi:aminocarboxymuconate-semialdehyde decarboxylase